MVESLAVRFSRVLLAPLAAAGLWCALSFASPALADDWELVRTGAFQALAVDPSAPSTVFVSTFGVRRSDDGGTTWSGGVDPLSSSVSELVIDPITPSTLYAVSGGSVYETTDAAANWTLLFDPGHDRRVTRLAIDRVAPSVLYAVVERRGCIEILGCYWLFDHVERSADAGTSWTSQAFSVAVESISAAGDTVYATTHSGGLFQSTAYGLVRSTDGGRSFRFTSRLPVDSGIRLGALAFDPASPQVVYVVSDGGLFKSADGGTTWSTVGTGVPVDAQTRLAIAPGAPGLIYAATTAGVYMSTDAAATWSASLNVPDASLLTVGPRGRVVYAVASSALYRLGAIATGQCDRAPTRLCLNGERFGAEVSWRTRDGRTGTGQAVPLTSDSGYFWFFADGNVELVVKVLDGRSNNGHYWVFYGALSDVAYTLTVTDNETGQTRTYDNPQDTLASVADTGAF